jgi:hypothetical protein
MTPKQVLWSNNFCLRKRITSLCMCPAPKGGGSQLWRRANKKAAQFIACYVQTISKYNDASAKAVFVLQPGKLPSLVLEVFVGHPRDSPVADEPHMACHQFNWRRKGTRTSRPFGSTLRTIGNGAGAARLCKSKH